MSLPIWLGIGAAVMFMGKRGTTPVPVRTLTVPTRTTAPTRVTLPTGATGTVNTGVLLPVGTKILGPAAVSSAATTAPTLARAIQQATAAGSQTPVMDALKITLAVGSLAIGAYGIVDKFLAMQAKAPPTVTPAIREAGAIKIATKILDAPVSPLPAGSAGSGTDLAIDLGEFGTVSDIPVLPSNLSDAVDALDLAVSQSGITVDPEGIVFVFNDEIGAVNNFDSVADLTEVLSPITDALAPLKEAYQSGVTAVLEPIADTLGISIATAGSLLSSTLTVAGLALALFMTEKNSPQQANAVFGATFSLALIGAGASAGPVGMVIGAAAGAMFALAGLVGRNRDIPDNINIALENSSVGSSISRDLVRLMNADSVAAMEAILPGSSGMNGNLELIAAAFLAKYGNSMPSNFAREMIGRIIGSSEVGPILANTTREIVEARTQGFPSVSAFHRTLAALGVNALLPAPGGTHYDPAGTGVLYREVGPHGEYMDPTGVWRDRITGEPNWVYTVTSPEIAAYQQADIVAAAAGFANPEDYAHALAVLKVGSLTQVPTYTDPAGTGVAYRETNGVGQPEGQYLDASGRWRNRTTGELDPLYSYIASAEALSTPYDMTSAPYQSA